MKLKRFVSMAIIGMLMLSMLCSCGTFSSANFDDGSFGNIDMSKWSYNSSDDVYYQVGIWYCENPVDTSYETMGIYVPGDYFDATKNSDGTYTCVINEDNTVGGYTAATAPMVMPVNTPGYSAMSAPTGYESSVREYTSQGFIYLYAGCRGRDDGAPWGVTDLKAAIRYVRSNSDLLPGDSDSIFSFGMSGGGAQSALLGATGDSDLYNPYLEALGAVMDESDAVKGSMCWCPITSLDIADEAYEWNLGISRSGLSSDEQALSDDLAYAFANYINELGLTDENGNALTLEESDNGIYQAGTYYDYLKGVIEVSLEHFLVDTEWPYTASASTKASGFLNKIKSLFGQKSSNDEDIYSQDNVQRTVSTSTMTMSGTYESAEDYIDALNQDVEWVSYDSSTGEVTITNIADFVCAFKNSSKSLAAFDQLDAGQAENTLFGYGDGNGAHFDSILASLLAENDYGNEYTTSYAEDLAKTDSLGTDVTTRVNMYNPLYYVCESAEGYGTSTVAPYFRIRTGINQSDTSLSTEVNLSLALSSYGSDVDFETVWGLGHTEAERTGDNTDNFIEWVNQCMQ